MPDQPIVQGGWCDRNNMVADYFDKAANFNDAPYIGTDNDVTGGQIWEMLEQALLPLIVR